MIRTIALSAAVVLLCAGAGSGDYVLVMPENGVGTGSCAKSKTVCEAARQTVYDGLMPDVPRETLSRCDPYPECFDRRSNCIVGYHGVRPEGECDR